MCIRCLFGKPIDPVLGSEIWFEQTGVKLRGGALMLTYDSVPGQRPASADNITSLTEPNGFGPLWHSSFHHKLQVSPSKKTALVSRGDGRVLSFTGDGAGNFAASGYNNASLASISGGYRFTDINSGKIETFDAKGQLQSIAGIDGSVLTFMYANGNLVSVTDGDGRSVQFAYANNVVSKIIAPDWQVILPAYDANRNLVSLAWPDGKTARFAYENAALPWALTRVVDENGTRHASIAYDAEGRAVSEELGDGVNKYAVSHTSGPRWVVSDTYDAQTDTIHRVHSWDAPTGTVVTTPNAQTLGIDVQSVFGMPVPASVSQPAGSGSLAAATATTFDAAGNVSSHDDAAATRTCSVYDSRNRETVRVEGLSNAVACGTVTDTTASLPGGARRIVTTWHPDWKLPTQVAEPLRRTTYVYHGQPDAFNGNATANCTAAAPMPSGRVLPLLCRKVVQSTLPDGTVDTSVPSNSTSYTYDAGGGMLTEKDVLGHETTYARYADGTFADDAYVGQVLLLLHGDGIDGSSVMQDSSLSPKTVNVAGGVSISTAESKFGGSSLYFDGNDASNTTLVLPVASEFHFAGAFTIEFWIRPLTLKGSWLYVQSDRFGKPAPVRIDLTASGQVNVLGSSDNANWLFSSGLTSTSALQLGSWSHVAVSDDGTTVRLFVNGVLQGSRPTWSRTASSDPVRIGGAYAAGDREFHGFIDDLRITKAVGRYTTAFTPPTRAFPPSGSGDAVGHRIGDVRTVTNAAGQTTQFTQYDSVGRVRQMIDPKGITTDITYTPRGWVDTVTVTPPGGGARTTTYTYDGVGQITSVALPDGTSLGYSYDAAHRLTGITDARGNSVSYTLDASGNRTQEEVTDPGGALRRSITRSFDTLNRLQQVTGGTQ
ncbi:LamG-like jellyroll fold domain-containing protein [Ramlibacter sp. AN1133]|uniref:LamG-like jellyroll fold domain-containing protein n=1 Tax=Ramlibacter sp. AN1133 TaxID=3133429 RepID=UPI0030C59C44